VRLDGWAGAGRHLQPLVGALVRHEGMSIFAQLLTNATTRDWRARPAPPPNEPVLGPAWH
jgi:hypothetical protein